MSKDDNESVFLDQGQMGGNDDQDKLHMVMDTQRWLMNNGFLNDMIKDQLYMYGAIVHKDIEAVELDIEFEKKNLIYTVYVPKSLLKKHNKFMFLRDKDGLWDLWRFRRLLKKEGNLDFSKLIGNFVGDFCGPNWGTTVIVKNIEQYVDSYETEDRQQGQDATADKQPDS